MRTGLDITSARVATIDGQPAQNEQAAQGPAQAASPAMPPAAPAPSGMTTAQKAYISAGDQDFYTPGKTLEIAELSSALGCA